MSEEYNFGERGREGGGWEGGRGGEVVNTVVGKQT